MSKNERPNVLWIVLDQLRYDTPGFNGNEVCHTPNMDRLAASGVNFRRAYTPCSLCTPARASLLTGRYAFSHGMGTNCDMYHSLGRELPDPSMLLHRRLQEAGYRCGFVGKWHVGTEKGPVDYGFEGTNVLGYGNIQTEDEYVDYLANRRLSYEVEPLIYLNPDGKTMSGGVWHGATESTPPHFLADYTIGMLENFSSSKRPFFITCNFWGPHPPYLPSDEYYNTHDRERIQEWENFNDSLSGKPVRVMHERNDFYRELPGPWEEWREVVGLSYDFTSMIDSEIGRILDSLDTFGVAEETVVMLTTDHGDMIGSHNQLFDKGFIYEEAHHIPLVISWPGVFESAATSDDLVSNMDLMPTVLDLCGMLDSDSDAAAELDGRSLLPALCADAERETRSVFLLEFHGLRYLYSQRAIVTSDGWKYVFSPADIDEVYNLNEDPAELENLIDSDDHLETIERLRDTLKVAVVESGDPIMDAVYRLLGTWDNPSKQIDATG